MGENKHTSEDLKIMQAWSLERKIQVTQTRIIEWYQRFDGNVYISFSGGKDSTVLLDMARRIYPDIEAVFIDTGLEYPEIRRFVKGFDNVTRLKPKMKFKDVIETYGYPVISKEVSECVMQARLALIKPDKYQYRLERINGTQKDKNGVLKLFRYKSTSCSVQKLIGLLVGFFMSKPLHPTFFH